MRCLVLIFAIFQCPPGSVVGLRAGDCYTYNPAAAWFDAEEECVTSGGHLASVHDVFTNSFLAKLPKYLATNSGTFWLGGSFGITTSDRWSWSDRSTFDFTHWASGNCSFSSDFFQNFKTQIFFILFYTYIFINEFSYVNNAINIRKCRV